MVKQKENIMTIATNKASEENLLHFIDGRNLPVNVGIELQNRCNVSCKMCGLAQIYKKTGLPPLRRTSLDEIKLLFQDVKLGGLSVAGVYSEPLMSRQFVEIADFVIKQGGHMNVTTNGTLLNKKMAEALVEIGFQDIYLSLHGATKEVAEYVMESSNFDRVVQNMMYLKQVKKAKKSSLPRLHIVFVAMQANFHELPNLVKLASELGAVDVGVKPLNRNSDNEKKLDNADWWYDQSLANHTDLVEKFLPEAFKMAKESGVKLMCDIYHAKAK